MSTIGVKAIKYPDGDSAINITDGGNVTLAGTLGVTGAFTSQGIDDNADATAITIDSSERVMIGTGTPPTADSVLTVQKSSAANEFNVISSPTHASVINLGDTDDYNICRIKGDNSNNSLQFQTNNAERMRIDTSGNVGIGTSSPADVRLSLFSGGSGTAGQLKLGYDNSNMFQIGRLDPVGTGSGNFQIKPNGGTSVFDITSAGKVGIGTNSPSAHLTVEPSARTTNFNAADYTTYADILVRNPTNDNTCATGIGFITDGELYTNGASGIAAISGTGDTESSLAFITRPLNAVAAERMRITSAGNVGIGTSSPDGTLHLENTNASLLLSNSGRTQYYRLQNNEAGDAFTINSNDTRERMRIADTGYAEFASESQVRITLGSAGTAGTNSANWIRGSGNQVDLNTAGAGYGFEVSGNAKVVFANNGSVTNATGSYGTISDVTLKENISDASSQWDDIKALQVRKYSMKEDDLDSANKIGVIAQELETSGMNGLVEEITWNSETTKTVKYSILYMKSIKALQEAMTRIETLEAEVKALKG